MPQVPEDAGPAAVAKNRRNFRLLLAFFGLLTAAVLGAGGVIASMVKDSPLTGLGRRLGKETALMDAARNAPGAAYLRDEAHCQRAAVFNTAELLDTAETLSRAQVPRDPSGPTQVAVCYRVADAPETSCFRLARALAARTKPEGKFALTVQTLEAGGGTAPKCSGVYTPLGDPMTKFSPRNLPLPPLPE